MTAKKILADLLDDIAAQRFEGEQKLPSEARLCERFGASRMTVRNALDELRRRGLIEKRNGAGSFLTARARRKSGIIGLVIPDFRQFAFFTGLRAEVKRHCRRLNYRIELVTAGDAAKDTVADIRHKVRKLAAHRAEGVIFRPYVSSQHDRENREIVQILRHAEIPTVLIDADISHPPERSECDLVAVDNIAAGRRIADHLHACGYRRIAFFADKDALAANANWSNRLFGLAGELALLGAKKGVSTLDPRDAKAVLRGRNRPDAVVCGNDESALALMAALRTLGLKVPDEVAVVGFDDSEAARQAALTTVSQPVGKIAATAFKTLLARIRYPGNDPRETFLATTLIPRATT